MLLRRLEVTYGFNGAVLQWLRSYVEDRMQSVHLNGSISRPHRVICGVPQGSVLGPLLFTFYTADIGIIVQPFGLKHHTYADDNQIYSSCFPAEYAFLKIKLIACIDVVDKWMASNRLMLNPSKSEFLWCTSPRRVLLLDRSAFVLRDASVDVSSVVKNLCAFFDVTMSMNDRINRLARSSYYQLRRIKSIRHALPTSTAIQLVNSFIISQFDYCNIILAGVPKYQLDRLQSNLNVAVRLIFGYSRSHHITPLLRDRLNWLRVPQRIDFKRCLMSSKRCMVSPQAISRTIVSETRQTSADRVYVLQVTTVWLCRLRQRPSSLENVRSQFAVPLRGTRCQTVKDADSNDVFKSRLKSYLFGLSYG